LKKRGGGGGGGGGVTFYPPPPPPFPPFPLPPDDPLPIQVLSRRHEGAAGGDEHGCAGRALRGINPPPTRL